MLSIVATCNKFHLYQITGVLGVLNPAIDSNRTGLLIAIFLILVTIVVTFELDRSQIPPSQTKLLEREARHQGGRIRRIMQQNPALQIEIQAGQTPSEIDTLAQERSLAIVRSKEPVLSKIFLPIFSCFK